NCEVLRWSRHALERLFAIEPALRAQLGTRLSLRSRRREIEQLARHSHVFRETSPILLRRLIDLSALVRYSAGDYLCRQGEQGDQMFLIVEGEVRIVREAGGSERDVAVLSRGDCLGEIAPLLRVPRVASVIAATDVEALIVGGGSANVLFAQS